MSATQDPKRGRLAKTVTIYGRNPVLEALHATELVVDRLHLAESNKPGGQIDKIRQAAEQLGLPISWHSRQALSRISRNGRQDQGVALDIYCQQLTPFDQWLANSPPPGQARIILLDQLSNPQNIGMCIRSCVAAGVDAILIAGRGHNGLNPLIIKASAGTALRAPLVYCQNLPQAARQLTLNGHQLWVLSAKAKRTLFDSDCPSNGVFVLGSETDGVSRTIGELATGELSIPMSRGVESLNVAVSCALLAFHIGRPQR